MSIFATIDKKAIYKDPTDSKEVPPLDVPELLAYLVRQSGPFLDQIGVRRGGRSSLGKEVDEVDGDDVDMEFESGERELNNNNYKNKNKRLQKRNHSAEDDLGSLFGDGISGKLPRFANKITLKNISLGMKLWGVIAEVNEKDIVISLPGGLRGLVRASEAFDPISDNKVKDVETNFLSSIYHVGQLVSCIVLQLGDDKKEKGKRKIWLSLRLALLHKTLTLDVIQEGMGYVKNITPKGCFIMLSRKLDAKILLSNLSDGYVENLEKEFPIGKLVVGKVASVEPLSKQVEVTLRTSNARKTQKSDINGLNSLHVGDIVSGQIKRIESYSLFITIDHTNTVDEDRQRVSLRMKNSYFMSNYDIQAPSKQKYDDAIEEKDHMVGTQLTMLPDRGSLGMQNLDFECENGQHRLPAEVEARASILPHEVPLDDIEKSDMVNAACQNIEHVDDADAVDQKIKSQAKKKANEEREREIRAAEERLLEKDIPRSADEFEKVVRISPNSSFVWIKYMAFMLSLADVEKARSIAERALKTINI